MIAITLLLYYQSLWGLPILVLGTVLIWIAALLTLVSMAYYLMMASRALQNPA
jgi:CDP-diacylglycerol--glycerol-3-phosphate 3-phosphatidyltransferase/cardiolipin synthase